MSKQQLQVIQAPNRKTAPALPPVMSISALALLAPSLLFLINFPTLINAVVAIGISAAVVLDRLSLRSNLRVEHAAAQEMLQKYIDEVNNAIKADKVGGVPKTKDGETLQ